MWSISEIFSYCIDVNLIATFQRHIELPMLRASHYVAHVCVLLGKCATSTHGNGGSGGKLAAALFSCLLDMGSIQFIPCVPHRDENVCRG